MLKMFHTDMTAASLMKNIFPKYTELSYFLSSGFSLVLLVKWPSDKNDTNMAWQVQQMGAVHGNDKHTTITTKTGCTMLE